MALLVTSRGTPTRGFRLPCQRITESIGTSCGVGIPHLEERILCMHETAFFAAIRTDSSMSPEPADPRDSEEPPESAVEEVAQDRKEPPDSTPVDVNAETIAVPSRPEILHDGQEDGHVAPVPRKTSGDVLGEYRLMRELGRGAMGVVFEAVHLRDGHRVALKTLPEVDASTLHLFKREFRTAANINHPNLIGLHALEADGGQWFFTMDIIEGIDFLSYVRPAGELHEVRLRDAFAQLAAGVNALHQQDIVHRDLKPSNVVVAENGRVVILDFGLVVELQEAALAQSMETLAGTPMYIAPEQLAGQTVAASSDRYALGVMLYEALCGQQPYSGVSVAELLASKLRDDAPPIPEDAAAPADLARLAHGLLDRDPANRPDPTQVAGAALSTQPASRRSIETVLVGRQTQLTQLQSAYDRVSTENEPQVVFVSGRSGEGKTSLIDHFLRQQREQKANITILAGRCYDRESVPYNALDSLVDTLTGHLRRLSDSDAALMMPDDINFLSSLFPVLRRVGVVDKLAEKDVPQLDEQQVLTRAFAALRSLLKRVTTQSAVVLVCDDLQWGDAESAQALYDVLRPPEAPALLFIGCYRSEEAATSPFLRKWRELTSDSARIRSHEVTVSPLTTDDCVQATVELLGQNTERIRRWATELARQTGGNSFLLTEAVSCLDPSSDSFRVMPIHEVIDSKLTRLPTEAANILQVIAVSGQPLPFEDVARATEFQQSAVSVITHMRSEKLVRIIGEEGSASVDTYHDKIRETVLSGLQEDRRQSLHGSLATAIERSVGPVTDSQLAAFAGGDVDAPATLIARVYDLSYHFDAAREPHRAYSYAMLAAEQASRQFSQRAAAEQFAIARRNAPAKNTVAQFRIAKGSGRALSLLGEYDEAATLLRGAATLTSDPVQQAHVLGLQAEIAHKQADSTSAIRLYSEALRKLGHFVPKSLPAALFAVSHELFVQFLHTTLPTRWYQRNEPLSPADELTVELANRNSIVYSYGNLLRMLWMHLKGLNLAETRQPARGLAYAYGLHPAPNSAFRLTARGLRYSDRSLEIAECMGDLLTLGHSYAMRSMLLCTSGQHTAAVESARNGIEILTRAGDTYVISIAECHASLSCIRLARVTEAIEFVSTGFERSIQLGDHAIAGPTLCTWTLATEGHLPFLELRARCRVDPDDHWSTSIMSIAEGIWHLQFERFPEAVRALTDGWRRARSNLVISIHTLLGPAWLTTALRRYAASLQDDGERGAISRRAWVSARQYLRWSRMYPSERAHGLRELGLLLHEKGKQKAALARMRASMKSAHKHGDVWQHALSSLECGRIEQSLGLPDGAERIAAAEAIITRVRAEVEAAIESRTVSSIDDTGTTADRLQRRWK